MIQHVKIAVFLFLITIFLNSCGRGGKIWDPADAREYPPEPDKRVKKNIEEGRGFRLMGRDKNSGTFDFASSNELWRASLDTIDFMPLVSANYSGGIIITDWYSDGNQQEESIKLTIRFLSNEIRVDALDIKIFRKKCINIENCKITETSGTLVSELKKSILKKASIYEKETKKKNFKPYINAELETD